MSASANQQPVRIALALVISLALTACAAPRDYVASEPGINDPFEAQNRQVHEFNRSLDRAIVRPAASGYSAVVPDPVENGLSNFARNLGEPSNLVNSILQGNVSGAGTAGIRFFVNSTIGILGLWDAATFFDIAPDDTDFGETLHVWGVPEGAYLELPILGPSTQRDTAGAFVDLFTNPLGYALDEPERYYGTIANVSSGLTQRSRFSDTIDSILYESADSYAQGRLIYLQNRRFELGQANESDDIDPFALDTEGF